MCQGLSISSSISQGFDCLGPRLYSCPALNQNCKKSHWRDHSSLQRFFQGETLVLGLCPSYMAALPRLVSISVPDLDLLSWFPGLTSDLIHHFSLVQWSGLLDEPGYPHPVSVRSLPLLALLPQLSPFLCWAAHDWTRSSIGSSLQQVITSAKQNQRNTSLITSNYLFLMVSPARTEEHQCLLTIRKGLHVLIKLLFDFL